MGVNQRHDIICCRSPTAPPPKPKKIESRKRRIHVGSFDGMDETGETHEATAASGRLTPTLNRLLPQNFPAIEGSESKPQHPCGRLSEDTPDGDAADAGIEVKW